jgi:hypothetical protein
MHVNGAFVPGLAVMAIGAALAVFRGRVFPKKPNAAAAIGLALACAGAIMTVAL